MFFKTGWPDGLWFDPEAIQFVHLLWYPGVLTGAMIERGYVAINERTIREGLTDPLMEPFDPTQPRVPSGPREWLAPSRRRYLFEMPMVRTVERLVSAWNRYMETEDYDALSVEDQKRMVRAAGFAFRAKRQIEGVLERVIVLRKGSSSVKEMRKIGEEAFSGEWGGATVKVASNVEEAVREELRRMGVRDF